ncbi:microtubule-associated protein 9 [Limosa lapponica baueri]|uniref:Microtubule-associated protein 9 n=1 Tax=Limosa lapponica baueri TaxID=1758121 RepID=A0A2I0UN15_LIMLA|nr:microtubule-associated protein 9 [Limosa lapponica baueri]
MPQEEGETRVKQPALKPSLVCASGSSSLEDELQEASSAPAAREETAEYSDDFESDEDGMLNGIGEELNASNSGAESSKKLVAVESPLSDDHDASQKAADLENEAADGLTLSFHEKKLQQVMLLESGNIQDDRKDAEECLRSENEGDDRKNNEECSAAEEDQDQKISTSDLKLEDNSRKSPSVTEAVMTTVDEKTKKLEKSADDSSDEMVKIAEGQIVSDTIQQVSVNDQSEHGEAKNTSKDSVKKPSETKERVLQNPKASLSERSLSPASLKKKSKAVPSATRISSQYLGTLKVLEDKRVQNNSTEFDKADSLRAAVFQNWLEKKRALLLELKRIEKNKAENLRNDAEKKEAVKREEAIASFEAWKKKKGREAKKLNEIKKVEELRKKKAAEETVQRTEAAQKAFEKWKERKAEYLREQNRKEKQSERIRKKKEEELVAEKKRDNTSAVEKWNAKKEKYMKQKKVEKILERRKQEIQQAKKEEKDKKAMEEYESWLEGGAVHVPESQLIEDLLSPVKWGTVSYALVHNVSLGSTKRESTLSHVQLERGRRVPALTGVSLRDANEEDGRAQLFLTSQCLELERLLNPVLNQQAVGLFKFICGLELIALGFRSFDILAPAGNSGILHGRSKLNGA